MNGIKEVNYSNREADIGERADKMAIELSFDAGEPPNKVPSESNLRDLFSKRRY